MSWAHSTPCRKFAVAETRIHALRHGFRNAKRSKTARGRPHRILKHEDAGLLFEHPAHRVRAQIPQLPEFSGRIMPFVHPRLCLAMRNLHEFCCRRHSLTRTCLLLCPLKAVPLPPFFLPLVFHRSRQDAPCHSRTPNGPIPGQAAPRSPRSTFCERWLHHRGPRSKSRSTWP